MANDSSGNRCYGKPLPTKASKSGGAPKAKGKPGKKPKTIKH